MKSLLNCHTKGMHSFPISFENNLYRRIFYAEEHHNLWETEPIAIAIHPHHVDIKISVLDGTLYNVLYEKDVAGERFGMFLWDSVILNGQGGFKRVGVGEQILRQVSSVPYVAGESTFMRACELHTVYVRKGEKAVWLIEEEIPTCDYFPVNYSNADLSKWTPDGLYQETTDEVKQHYIGEYLHKL